MTDDETRHGIGANFPPDPETIQERLTLRYGTMLERMKEIRDTFATVPQTWEDEGTQGKAQELFKDMRSILGQADNDRSIEKEPYLKAGQAVDGFFKNPIDEIKKLRDQLKERMDSFLAKKKEKSRIEKERKEKEERDRADRLRREAEESERRARAAEQQRLEEERRAIEARRRKEQEEAAAAAAQRRSRRIQAITPYLGKRAAREADVAERKVAEKAARDAAAQARRDAEEEARAARSRASDARKEEKTADKAADRHADAVADHGDAAQLNLATAQRADKAADKAGRQASGSAADLSRTRSDGGAVGSLAKRWVAEVVDWQSLKQGGAAGTEDFQRLRDLGVLIGFVHQDALSAAVEKAKTAGIRTLPGVHYEEVEEGRYV